MSEGLFVTIEGIDGSGKSTAIDAIENNVPDVATTREPTPLWTGEHARRAIDADESHPLTDFHHFMADRVENVEQTVRPALADGSVVVCDRYIDSTRAYQQEALEEHVNEPERFIEVAHDQPWYIEPHLTILLDIDTQTAASRSSDGDKYEDSDFLKAVRRNYKEVAAGTDRIIELDGTKPEKIVRGVCAEIVGEAARQHFE